MKWGQKEDNCPYEIQMKWLIMSFRTLYSSKQLKVGNLHELPAVVCMRCRLQAFLKIAFNSMIRPMAIKHAQQSLVQICICNITYFKNIILSYFHLEVLQGYCSFIWSSTMIKRFLKGKKKYRGIANEV